MDFYMRASADGDRLEATKSSGGDYFEWYEGEEIVFTVRERPSKSKVLAIKLDRNGNVSFQRFEPPR